MDKYAAAIARARPEQFQSIEDRFDEEDKLRNLRKKLREQRQKTSKPQVIESSASAPKKSKAKKAASKNPKMQEEPRLIEKSSEEE